jgi:hypothetical protein
VQPRNTIGRGAKLGGLSSSSEHAHARAHLHSHVDEIASAKLSALLKYVWRAIIGSRGRTLLRQDLANAPSPFAIFGDFTEHLRHRCDELAQAGCAVEVRRKAVRARSGEVNLDPVAFIDSLKRTRHPAAVLL